MERRQARLPQLDPDCPPQVPAIAPPLSIVGVRQGDQLRRPATSSEPLRLEVSALGGSGRRWWFLNGVPLRESLGQEHLSARFEQTGRMELSALDESGQTARVEFQINE
ncbi:penicillin-binding protein 1C [compost metagenome]